jgi:aminopeptidase YwaD
MLRENWINEFSPRNAFEIEYELSRYHRAKGGEGYSKAVEVIRSIIGDSKVLKYPAGVNYEGWITPAGWNLKGGFLKINGKYVVADLSLSPISAIFMSGATNGVQKLQLVDVEKGETLEDYDGKDVKGKAVLTSGDISRVYDLAVEKFGAKCVLSSFMRFHVKSIKRTPELLPHAVNYTSFPPYANGEAFGFALSYEQYKWIKSQVKKGKTEVEAKIDADRGNNALEVIETRFGKKSSKQPIIMTAHLCHPRPGANDNASGSALLAELVRVLKKVGIDREIVALWVPEMYGTIAYLRDHDADFELGINLDMVGEDQLKTGSILQISSTPWSLPSFVSDLLYANLQNANFKMMTGEYSGGSDHFIFTDATIGTPSTSLTQFPDRYYHTSEDTSDKASVQSFEWIGKGVLNSLFDITYDFSKSTSTKIQANIVKEFMENYEKSGEQLVKKWVSYMAYKKMKDLEEYTTAEALEEVLNPFVEKAKGVEGFSESKHLRKIRGPIQDVWMNAEDREWFFKVTTRVPSFRDFRYELLNFMELGFSFDDAFKLSKWEFDISQDVLNDAKYYVKRLSQEKII